MNKTIAYAGSTISQDFSEGDDSFHGYLLWNVENRTVEPIPIKNEYSYKNIRITPYMDFNDLDFEIENPTKYMKLRFIWGTLPQTRTKDNERKLIEYVKSKYENLIISHKNEFLENKKIDVSENITIENITNKTVQHEIFREFLEKIGTDAKVINDVIALDEEILNIIDITDNVNIEWNIIKFGGRNFMSYAELDIDWRDMDGLFQITGINTAGKTTIMKIISYILFNKTLETESRKKFGDLRFVNNRNNANYCSAYMVIEANGEYYGIKKKTEITKSKDGSISGAPTTLNYFVLSNPDEEMNDDTLLEKLDEDKRKLTQKKLELIIGSYDNFMRIVMTTSDTLNEILKNDMADFIDSLLFDCGLDIFDKKQEGWKTINKKINEKSRVFCNIETTTNENIKTTEEIRVIETEINEIETIKLPNIQNRIQIGRNYVEDLTKKLFKIDPEIYTLNIDDTKNNISIHQNNIINYNARKKVLENSISLLKESYDEKKLILLNEKKEAHKTSEYNKKLNIKVIEQFIRDEEHAIEIINGEIFRLRQDDIKLKTEIQNLKNSKVCSQCGQIINKKEHQDHINNNIKIKENEILVIAQKIKDKENTDKQNHLNNIETKKSEIISINKSIEISALKMENTLKDIGELTNDKNDVEKRKELSIEINQIPTLIQNEELKIELFQQKIDKYNNSLIQIEENHKIEKGINAAKQKLLELEVEESKEKENIFTKKTSITEKQNKIKNNENLINEFKAQEYRDMVMNLYKKCVHRDGIPRQLLSNYIIPKINNTLENILVVAPFKVWLDLDDLRPKLIYNNRPNSVIDCISASGKERTFSSVVLKFALNQINIKTKPTIFLLDEVMGKLNDESIEEFIEILQMIKAKMKKVLVIEHNHEIDPNFIIEVTLDENGISSLIIT